LADFEAHHTELAALGVRVVALSADTAGDARGRVDELGLGFPVAYDIDVPVVSQAIGAYSAVRKGRPHLQPAAFVLSRDGTVAYAVYSSGKVGRLTAGDALVVVKGLLKEEQSTA
jgi:peroxiredoxin